MPDPSPTSATYTTAHSNAGSLTHWARPGIKPESSWILVRFVTTEPWLKLPRDTVLLSVKSIVATDLEIGNVFHRQNDLILILTHQRPEDTDWKKFMKPGVTLSSFRKFGLWNLHFCSNMDSLSEKSFPWQTWKQILKQWMKQGKKKKYLSICSDL